IFEHMAKSGGAIIRSYLMFRAHSIFKWATVIFAVLGMIPFVRYLVFLLQGESGSHVQSLLVGIVLLVCALISLMLLIISELLRIQRKLAEDQLERSKEILY
ncbi:glycosyltransferase family 2 protein, partial [Faecalicatena contorta]